MLTVKNPSDGVPDLRYVVIRHLHAQFRQRQRRGRQIVRGYTVVRHDQAVENVRLKGPGVAERCSVVQVEIP